MSAQESLVFKFASEDWEFEQIHRLNYRTFVEEIPQHQASPTQRLVDKFHAENAYLICLSNQKLAGMLAVRGHRPFSLDQKLPNLDSFLPAGRTVCEIRLLAIEKKFRGARGGQVLQGILALLWQHGVEKGYDLAIISGTTRQQRLYQHLGFVPFGPLVGSGDAQFQPMYVTLETFEVTAREFLRSSPARSFHPSAVNFMPGPVAVRREVRRAFEQAPESHRGESFKKDFQAARQILCELVRSKHVELFVGSGTLANDAVAGQLSLLKGRGLILTNGEFGERLVDHARRFKLKFDTLAADWGQPLDLKAVEKKLAEIRSRGRKSAHSGKSSIVNRQSSITWLWCAYCETSTGLLADVDALKALCAKHGVKLCLDAISAIGALPVDLSGVYLASCSSGKGLRAYPGISMVFYNHEIAPEPDKLPRYLDLGYYAEESGTPFTFSSNLLHALHAAVKRVNWAKRFAETAEWSAWLRSRLAETGFDLIGNGTKTSPAVVTIALPPEMNSVKIGEAMQESGYLLSYNSGYLRRKNWIQICLMGECTYEKVVSVTNALNRVCFRRHVSSQAPAAVTAK
ncbi:MAG TPA: aminotransferase class V-fold PLP-dependent enzyme [Verrucomicrobiae bacterium]|nr:aminotransferase class V-fold PLP-dependent enzyme [Verrucomicrobiae bacterium]